MFKKLKDKIAEEVKQSPSKISATVSQLAQAVVSPSSSSIVEPTSISDLNFSISEDAEEQSSPAKQGFTSVDLREESSANAINLMRSRRSSTSSLVSDNASFFPHYEPHGSSFHLQSDLESASEMEDSYSTQATSTSKEHLVGLLRKSQQRYNKYKGRYADLAKHYRELERDNYKAKTILSESQDKALRRIAELKEQCQLEQRAKAHLEEILRNDLEEKDHLIMTLNTKIDLLRLNESLDSNLDTPLVSTSATELNSQPNDVQHNMFTETLIEISKERDSSLNDPANDLGDASKDKVKKLEVLLAKCKDAIKMHKEKVKEYSTENGRLKTDLVATQETSSRQLKNLEAAQAEIVWLKRREEESALSLAETKRSIHSEMEIKEEQIKHLRQSIQDINSQKDEINNKCNKLENQVTEMKQNQEVKLSSAGEEQIQELSRMKHEAIKILQSRFNETIADLETESNSKISQLEKQVKELMEKNDLLEKDKLSQVDMEKQMKELMETNQCLQNNNLSSEVKLQEYVAGALALQSQILNLETENESLQTKVRIAEVQATLNDNNSESKYTENMETLEIVIANLQESLSQLQTQNSALHKTLIEKEKYIDQCLAESKRLHDDNVALSLINSTLDGEVQDLAAALSNANICVSKIRIQLQETQHEHESVNDSNQNKIIELSQKLLALNEKVASTEKESEDLKKTIAANEGRLVELLAQLSTSHEQLVKSRTTLAEVSSKSLELERSLHAQLTHVSTEHESMKKEHDELVKSLQSKVKSKDAELEAALSELSIQKDEFEARIDTLTVAIENLTSQLREKQTELCIQKEELTALKQSVNVDAENLAYHRTERFEEFERLEKELADNINQLTLNNGILVSQLAEKQAELNSQNEAFVEREASLKESNVKLNALFSETQAELASKMKDLKEQESLLNADKEKLILLLEDKQAELARQKGMFELQLAEKQAILTSQLDSLSKYDEKFASMVANTQGEMQQISLEVLQMQEINSKATLENDDLLAKLNETRTESDRKTNVIEELHNELKVMREASGKLETVTEQHSEALRKNRQLSEKLEQDSVRHKELSEALASIKSDLEVVRVEKNQLEKELMMQTSQGTDLSEVVKQFQNEKQQSCSQFEELQVKLESQEQDIEQLTQRLNDCTAALEQRNKEFEENEETQRQNIKLLARNFEEKLHSREDELSKLFDEERAKLESTEGLAVNQLRTHIKALKTEVRQAEDTISDLNKKNKDLVKQQEAEIIALQEKMKDQSLANEFEMRESNQKWKRSLEKELSEQEMIHKEEVNALSKEWSLERKTPSSTEISTQNQELESTSKVAVAAVESGTGSIDLMHRQLLSITRELNDAKRRHKIETVELRRIIENRSKGGETTELEYLRNILFEYMMGREPTVLVRVIAAVLKFDPDQTNKIIEKEEHKQSLLGHLGLL